MTIDWPINLHMYKYGNNFLPQIFTNQFIQISCINPYNVRSSDNNYSPTCIFCCTNIRQFTFRYIWVPSLGTVFLSVFVLRKLFMVLGKIQRIP